MKLIFKRRLLKFLDLWKSSPSRKPLIIRGARQVGKTSLIKLFAKAAYNNLIYLNLDQVEQRQFFAQIQSVHQLFEALKLQNYPEVRPGEDLLFIDEIQNCPNLYKLLRFFYEDYPDIHIITAGSLLEKILEKEQPSIPVGRVSYAYLYPLDFFEFLQAIEQNELLNQLEQTSLSQPLSPMTASLALKQLQIYLLVGGMPEAVSTYAQTRRLGDLDPVFSQLLTSYADDIVKYARQQEVKYIDHVLLNAYTAAGKLFRYSNFAGTNYSNKEIEPAFRALEKVMVLNQLPATSSRQLPLISQLNRPKKLITLDIGLTNYQAKIRQDILQDQDLNAVFRGSTAEQLVGQNIIAQATFEKIPLNYWAQPKAVSAAEVDFCLVNNSQIVGVEVKSGVTGKLKSLFAFADKVNNHKLVRIYPGILKQETVIYHQQKYALLSLPVYLIPRFFELISG